jgi:hypothetical protein
MSRSVPRRTRPGGDVVSEAEDAQRNVAANMPAMHSEVGQALSLLSDTLVALVAVTERQAEAAERIADRLDSLTYEPPPPLDHVVDPNRGPELRVRRW